MVQESFRHVPKVEKCSRSSVTNRLHSDPAFVFNCNKAKSRNYPFVVQTFGYWSVFIPHRADPTRGTFPRNTSISARRDAAIPDGDDESDSGASSEMFYPVSRQPPKTAWSSTDFLKEVATARDADAKGDFAVADDAKPEVDSVLAMNDTPILKYCRVYDCDDILDAFIVWLIAILHLRNGKINNKDFSGFICELFNWPKPTQ